MDGPLATAGAAKLQPGLGPAARCSHKRLIGWRCLRTPYIACAVADDLQRATTTESLTSTDAGITTSFPGLGPLTGARGAEAGGFPAADPASRMPRPTPGPCPSPASGKTTAVLHRRVKTSASPRRPAQPLRRLLGCLHHCRSTGQHYGEITAFPRPHPQHPPEQPDNLTAPDVFVPRLTPRNQRASTRDRRRPSSPH
jgi:hypothetical protein